MAPFSLELLPAVTKTCFSSCSWSNCCGCCRLCISGLWRNQRMMLFLWNCESLLIVHHCSVKLFNWIYISPNMFFSMPQGQSFIPMMMLLRELLANLNWTIQQKFGLHPTIATLSNLNHNPSNIEEWSICWTCSSITIRLTFFVSFGQYEHGFL